MSPLPLSEAGMKASRKVPAGKPVGLDWSVSSRRSCCKTPSALPFMVMSWSSCLAKPLVKESLMVHVEDTGNLILSSNRLHSGAKSLQRGVGKQLTPYLRGRDQELELGLRVPHGKLRKPSDRPHLFALSSTRLCTTLKGRKHNGWEREAQLTQEIEVGRRQSLPISVGESYHCHAVLLRAKGSMWLTRVEADPRVVIGLEHHGDVGVLVPAPVIGGRGVRGMDQQPAVFSLHAERGRGGCVEGVGMNSSSSPRDKHDGGECLKASCAPYPVNKQRREVRVGVRPMGSNVFSSALGANTELFDGKASSAGDGDRGEEQLQLVSVPHRPALFINPPSQSLRLGLQGRKWVVDGRGVVLGFILPKKSIVGQAPVSGGDVVGADIYHRGGYVAAIADGILSSGRA
eukprot:6480713-Amphidinium_carterae.4